MDEFCTMTDDWRWCFTIALGTDPRECAQPNPYPCPHHNYTSAVKGWFIDKEYVDDEYDFDNNTKDKSHQLCRSLIEQHAAPYQNAICLLKSASPSARIGHFDSQHFKTAPELAKGMWSGVWIRLELKKQKKGTLHGHGLSASVPPPVATISSHPRQPQSLPPVSASSNTNISIGVASQSLPPLHQPPRANPNTSILDKLPMETDHADIEEEPAMGDFMDRINQMDKFKHSGSTGIKTGSTPQIPLIRNLINNVYYHSVLRADPSCISHSYARQLITKRYFLFTHCAYSIILVLILSCIVILLLSLFYLFHLFW